MYLHKIEIRNYSCLRDVKLEFTPLHALIGPNDSGKSTILCAVRTLTRFFSMAAESAAGAAPPNDPGFVAAEEPRLAGRFGSVGFAVELAPGPAFKVHADDGGSELRLDEKGSGEPQFWGLFAKSPKLRDLVRTFVADGPRTTMPANLLRLDPDELRRDSDLIPEKEAIGFYDQGGRGMRGSRLPGIYDAIMNRGDDTFSRIAQRTRELFPTVRNVRLRAVSSSQKCLEVELTNGKRVPAAQMSEGLLYFLAYAALPYLAPTSMLLVEEPENGLHPSRIRDVMNILREISKTTQVLVATHSPLVVNELKGDEVTVVTRHSEHGTQVRRLNATPDYEVRSRAYLPGELWLNYANGVDETDLLNSGNAQK